LNEYKGIKRGSRGSLDIFSHIDTYCTRQDKATLNNDILLQDKVKAFYKKRNREILLLNVFAWGFAILVVYISTKG